MAVVLFHAFPSRIPGGFVGVDIFFVISGFLITGIILRNLKSGCFSFSDFWARRIRRIFPSLLTVVVAVSIAGWFYLLPSEFETLKSHIKWGLGFAANFKLNSEVGYFDVSSDLKPLLHLWSLAIEEQFYFVWPGLLWFCFNKRLNLFTVTFLLAVGSFLTPRFFAHTSESAFYMPWTRFWELQIGALIAIYYEDYDARFLKYVEYLKCWIRPFFLKDSDAASRFRFLKSTVSLVGAALVFYACFKFDKSTPFPSKFTFIPVLGATLLIISGRDAWFNRNILALRPMVFIGLISFPLYLWHWPMLSFVRIIYGTPSVVVVMVIVLLAVMLSIITFKMIEPWLRFEEQPKSSTPIFAYKAIGLLVSNLALILLLMSKANILIPRSAALNDLLSTKAAFKPTAGSYCRQNFPIEICQMAREDAEPTVVLIGDSHANHLFPGLTEKLKEENLLLVAKSGTPPLYKVSSLRGQPSNLNAEFEKILKMPSVKTIVLAGFWGNYIEQNGIKVAGYYYKNLIQDELNLQEADQSEVFRSGLTRTIDLINKAKKNLIVFYDIPSLPFSLSNCSPRPGLVNKFVPNCSFSLNDAYNKEEKSRRILKEIIEKHSNVHTYDIFDKVCVNNNCSVFDEKGKWLYSDDFHLSIHGASYALKELDPEKWNF